MIVIGKAYMIFKPKEITVKGEKGYRFSIGNSTYNKTTNSWEQKGFINVVARTNQFLSDRDKVTIAEITGCDTSEDNEKTNVTLFVKLAGEQQGNYEAVEPDMLPF